MAHKTKAVGEYRNGQNENCAPKNMGPQLESVASQDMWVWVQIKPPGIGPQVLVHVSTYQGKPFVVHIFDNHSHLKIGARCIPGDRPGAALPQDEARANRVPTDTAEWCKAGSLSKGWSSHLPKANRPFDLLVFPFWSIFSEGPKRLTLYFQVFWASESWIL